MLDNYLANNLILGAKYLRFPDIFQKLKPKIELAQSFVFILEANFWRLIKIYFATIAEILAVRHL